MNTEIPELEALGAQAEAGDAEAQFAMGEALYPDDYLAAIKWYRAAASQDHTESQYRAGFLLSIYEGSNSDAREAIKWLEKAAHKGHLKAMQELAQIYLFGWEGRHGGYDGKSLLYKNLPQAFRLYEKLCALGDYMSYHQCGLMLLEGSGVPKNTEEGLGYMLLAACSHPLGTRAFAILSDCYARGVGADPNPVEAYIWALIAKANDFIGDYISEHDARIAALEGVLRAPIVIRKAQNEARRRGKLSKEGNLTPEYCLAQAAKYKPGPAPGDRVHIIGRAVIPEEPTAQARDKPSDNRAVLTTWKVADIGKICVHLNQKDKNIRVTYGRHKARFGLTELFSRSALRLLIDYDKHATDGREPAISYRGNSVNAFLKLRRDNQDVVSDFNTAFRKLFGLDKDAKAFTWLPGSKARPQDKTLKIHFQLQVHYRV